MTNAGTGVPVWTNAAAGSRAADGRNFWRGLWRLADPRLTLASLSSILLGAAAAWAHGGLSWAWLGVTVLGICCIEVAKNAHGEIRDFDSGADAGVADEDRSPFSGGRRVLIEGTLSRRQTAAICAAGYGLGIAAGLAIVSFREPSVFWVGLTGVALAWFYYAHPARLAYQGLGEAAVALAYGPVICCGTYLSQTGAISREAMLLSVPLGLMVSAFLLVNEFPDYRADRAAGKRNLVVRMGRVRASRLYAGMVAGAFLLQALLPGLGFNPLSWLGLCGLPPAAAAVRRLMRWPETTALVIAAQRWTLESFVLMAVGAGVGVALSG